MANLARPIGKKCSPRRPSRRWGSLRSAAAAPEKSSREKSSPSNLLLATPSHTPMPGTRADSNPRLEEAPSETPAPRSRCDSPREARCPLARTSQTQPLPSTTAASWTGSARVLRTAAPLRRHLTWRTRATTRRSRAETRAKHLRTRTSRRGAMQTSRSGGGAPSSLAEKRRAAVACGLR